MTQHKTEKKAQKPRTPESRAKVLEQAALLMEEYCTGKHTGNFLYTDTIARCLRKEAKRLLDK